MTSSPAPAIRCFEQADAPAVIALWTEVFGYTTAHNDPAQLIAQKLALQPELFFVATVDGRIVGTVMGGYDGHRGWIYSLAVPADMRRQGVARSLMQKVERDLAKLGCLKVNLQVLKTNAATVAFYEKVGYAVEQRVSMGKLLNSQPA